MYLRANFATTRYGSCPVSLLSSAAMPEARTSVLASAPVCTPPHGPGVPSWARRGSAVGIAARPPCAAVRMTGMLPCWTRTRSASALSVASALRAASRDSLPTDAVQPDTITRAPSANRSNLAAPARRLIVVRAGAGARWARARPLAAADVGHLCRHHGHELDVGVERQARHVAHTVGDVAHIDARLGLGSPRRLQTND